MVYKVIIKTGSLDLFGSQVAGELINKGAYHF
jgi:hypothetical protein